MSPRKQSPPSFEYVLLGLLKQQPMHGYELAKAVSRLAGVALVWQVKQSQLYALLERLEELGWVTATRLGSENRPMRKEYHLSAAGLECYHDWIQSPVEHGREIRQVFIAKLYFAQLEGSPAVRSLIAAQQSACRQWLADEEQSGEASAWIDQAVLAYRRSHILAILGWLEDLQHSLALV